MRAERYVLPDETTHTVAVARRRGRVLAVDATSLRAFEAAADPDVGVRADAADTSLYIISGYRFRVVDGLLTNFDPGTSQIDV